MKSYLRSDEFRQMLSQQIGYGIGGQAEISPIEWQGARADTNHVELESRRFGNWTIEGTEAQLDLGGMRERVWRIPAVEIRSAKAEWDLRKDTVEGEPASQKPASGKGSQKEKKESFFVKWLPNRTELLSLKLDRFEGQVAAEQGNCLLYTSDAADE